ncbi:MAG: hypothetical protein ACRD0P_14275 [Stackebrandtia sp.]
MARPTTLDDENPNPGLGDVARSLIRTWVPIAVAALVTWLASIGVDLPAEQSAGLATAAVTIISGLYYTAARIGEKQWPWLGYLLGSKTPPTYNR